MNLRPRRLSVCSPYISATNWVASAADLRFVSEAAPNHCQPLVSLVVMRSIIINIEVNINIEYNMNMNFFHNQIYTFI